MTYLMRLPKFEYLGPRSLAEVCGAIAGPSGNEVMLLAGGTDAILQMRRRERVPRRVVGLKGVAELDFVREEADGGVAIGAMTTLRSLVHDPRIAARYDLLRETAAQIGGHELRNVATIGGNIAGALPCADLPPALMTLGARIRLSSARGDRWLALDEFFPEFGRTVARADELLSEIGLPRPAPRSGGTYLKFHDRQSMDMTVVGVSAWVALDDEGRTCRDLRLAYANSAPTVFRAKRAEAVLRGQALTDEGLEAVAEAACGESRPRTSWRANGAYRLELIAALTRRAIRRAWDKAASQGGAKS
ncbi:MAG: FAD binding domain-containing protein [Betaproteobacteria bacterium]|nr:FAD binding domain-containing protein [Betaproteobacteria bacterium]